MMKQENQTTARARYTALESERKSYTDRAETSAKYTIPMAFPKATDTSSTAYETPYQSVGARGVNNLVSKLMLALFPPNEPFFRLALGEEVSLEMESQPDQKAEMEKTLAILERKIISEMESTQIRTNMYEALLQLVLAGNVLLFLPPHEGGMRLFRLNSYVVKRDGIGNVIEIVAVEKIAYGAMPDEAKRCITEADPKADTDYEIYTHTYLEEDSYISYQEINGIRINGSEQTYPRDKSPWIPLRLKKMDGESYGRSFIDEYIGDLKALESLSKSIVEISAISANIIHLVAPNSMTKISELAKAQSGDFIRGRADDITTLQLDKTRDLQIVHSTIQSIEGRLSYAFLLNSAVQRNAERVTAEEIRYVARELEDTVGSIYSILAQELQLPLIKRFMAQMQSQGSLPELPEGSMGVEPMIVTGIEALGRGHDLGKLDTFIRYAQVFPEAFQSRVKQGSILMQIATALGINASEVVLSDMEYQQQQQMREQQQMAQNIAPQVVQGAMEQ